MKDAFVKLRHDLRFPEFQNLVKGTLARSRVYNLPFLQSEVAPRYFLKHLLQFLPLIHSATVKACFGFLDSLLLRQYF